MSVTGQVGLRAIKRSRTSIFVALQAAISRAGHDTDEVQNSGVTESVIEIK
jgi:hypothetical protein